MKCNMDCKTKGAILLAVVVTVIVIVAFVLLTPQEAPQSPIGNVPETTYGCDGTVPTQFLADEEICDDGWDNDCDGLIDRTSTNPEEDLCPNQN